MLLPQAMTLSSEVITRTEGTVDGWEEWRGREDENDTFASVLAKLVIGKTILSSNVE